MQVHHSPDRAARSPRFAAFIDAFDRMLLEERDEARIRARGLALLADLVANDDWLAPRHAAPDPARYRQIPLHLDPEGRFSVVAFVWGPGQVTPIHDHTVWGLIGVLQGAEISQGYRFVGPGRMIEDGAPQRLERGAVAQVSPMIGDVHRVRNAFDDSASISIHVYGGDIGALRRGRYDEDGTRHEFVSGYSEDPRSADAPTRPAARSPAGAGSARRAVEPDPPRVHRIRDDDDALAAARRHADDFVPGAADRDRHRILTRDELQRWSESGLATPWATTP